MQQIAELIELLSDDNPDTQQKAIDALVEKGTESVESLINALSWKEETQLRSENAAKALAQLADDKVIEELKQMLGDYFPSTRTGAGLAFIQIGGERAIRPLMQIVFSDAKRDHREFAEIVLEEIGKEIVEFIKPMLEHENNDYRIRASRLLRKVGS